MRRIALTGGIATGKSYVVAELRRRGVPCVDADELAHGVTAAGTEATAAIADRFGDVLEPSGAVDRKRLGAIVFADAAARRDLEAIVHPAVYRALSAALRGFELVGGHPFAVADIPLLYETGREKEFERVIVTTCSPETQVERLKLRGLTEVQAKQRLAAQMPAAEKAKRADYVIDTEGTFEATKARVAEVVSALAKS